MRFVPSTDMTAEEGPRIPTVRRVTFPRLPAPGGQPGSQPYHHASQAFQSSPMSVSLAEEPAVWLQEGYVADELPRGGQGAVPCSSHLPFYKQGWFWPAIAVGAAVGVVLNRRK